MVNHFSRTSDLAAATNLWDFFVAYVGATAVLIVTELLIGLIDWNGMNWPVGLRWGLGLPLILIGNAVVWSSVFNIGMAATSGAVDSLKTDSFYRWPRNPQYVADMLIQYVADMLILIGWAILSASAFVIPLTIGGIARVRTYYPDISDEKLSNTDIKYPDALASCIRSTISLCQGNHEKLAAAIIALGLLAFDLECVTCPHRLVRFEF